MSDIIKTLKRADWVLDKRVKAITLHEEDNTMKKSQGYWIGMLRSLANTTTRTRRKPKLTAHDVRRICQLSFED